MRLTHDTVDLTAVAGLVCLGAGLGLLGIGSVVLVRSLARMVEAGSDPGCPGRIAGRPVPDAERPVRDERATPCAGRARPADRGLSSSNAEFVTVDGVALSGWYLPSTNGAAVVLLHGASSTEPPCWTMPPSLPTHGYGVLLYDARGHGRSGGTAMDFGWYGDLDIAAALSYLESRPEVDPARLGAVGVSMGGEQVVGAAATDTRIRAVVGEGVTGRGFADKGWLPGTGAAGSSAVSTRRSTAPQTC